MHVTNISRKESNLYQPFYDPPAYLSQTKNEREVHTDNYKHHVSLPPLSDKETVLQQSLEIKNLRQQLNLSDDINTSTKDDITLATSFTSSIMTEEEGKTSEGVGIEKESIIQSLKSDEMFFYQKTNEILENENKKILRDLSMREQEVSVLATRCAAQGERMKGLREARIMAKEIEQLNSNIKYKDVSIGELGEKLARAKEEATESLEKMKEVKTSKCKEINILLSTVNDMKKENKLLGLEVVKIKADAVIKDAELKEKREIILLMTSSKLEQEEKLKSIHSQTKLLALSIDKSGRDHSKKVTALKLEINSLKTCCENKSISCKENIVNIEQLEKISTQKDKTIEQQKRSYAEIEKELAEKVLLINEITQKKEKSEDELAQTLSLVVALRQESQSRIQGENELRTKHLQLQKDMKKEEEAHKERLKNEIAIRHRVETNMKTMRSEICELKKQGANYAELQKTVLHLEDKVKRQENYLKKKLQQERKQKLSSTMPSIKTLSRRQNSIG